MEPSRQMKSFLPLPVSDLHFKLRKSRKITGCLGWWITACPETQIRNGTADVNSEILTQHWYNQTCILKQFQTGAFKSSVLILCIWLFTIISVGFVLACMQSDTTRLTAALAHHSYTNTFVSVWSEVLSVNRGQLV